MPDTGEEVPPGVVGEIVGRGPITMPGYYKRPDLTDRAIIDGWLHTGDLGYVDEDGFLYLVDRQKDLIISGGVNVYLRFHARGRADGRLHSLVGLVMSRFGLSALLQLRRPQG